MVLVRLIVTLVDQIDTKIGGRLAICHGLPSVLGADVADVR